MTYLCKLMTTFIQLQLCSVFPIIINILSICDPVITHISIIYIQLLLQIMVGMV